MIVNNSVLKYLLLIKEWHKKHHATTEQQIDTLFVIYILTKNNRVFDLLFSLHLVLLTKISRESFNKYKRYLSDEDYDDIFLMVQGEFNRRVEHYKFPPEAPFSKYIKLYIKKWINSYTKLMVKKNQKYTTFTDYEYDNIEE